MTIFLSLYTDVHLLSHRWSSNRRHVNWLRFQEAPALGKSIPWIPVWRYMCQRLRTSLSKPFANNSFHQDRNTVSLANLFSTCHDTLLKFCSKQKPSFISCWFLCITFLPDAHTAFWGAEILAPTPRVGYEHYGGGRINLNSIQFTKNHSMKNKKESG